MPPLDHSFICLFTYSLIHSLVNSYICTLTHLSQSSPVSLKNAQTVACLLPLSFINTPHTICNPATLFLYPSVQNRPLDTYEVEEQTLLISQRSRQRGDRPYREDDQWSVNIQGIHSRLTWNGQPMRSYKTKEDSLNGTFSVMHP